MEVEKIQVPIIENVAKCSKKKHKGLAPRKRKMVEAMAKSLGIVTTACQEVGINRITHSRWYKEDLDYKEAIDDLEVRKEDVIEKAFLSLVIDKNPQAVIHAVKTKLKHRGYGEDIKQTIETKGEGFKLVIEVPDERDQMETK
jgi:hypothetical protein